MSDKAASVSAGKLVLITGASSGIGEATAELFALRGARVLLLARNQDKPKEIIEDLEGYGAKAAFLAVDLAKADEVSAAAERIKSEYGIPDVVINNAGAGGWIAAAATSLDEARQMIELPYLAAFYVTRSFLPEMIARSRTYRLRDIAGVLHRLAECLCLYRRAPRAEGLHRSAAGRFAGCSGQNNAELRTVNSPYWQNNPGSRAHMPVTLPFLMPELSTRQAAAVIIEAIERARGRVVTPWFYRVLFWLNLGR